MRAANLFLFLGTVGFINIYEEMTSDDESGTGKLDPSDAKRLQRKFGVKEKRSATNVDRQAAAVEAAATRPLNFADYDEVQVVEHLKRPVYRVLTDCASADGTACNCLKLLCFGQAECTAPATLISATSARPGPGAAKQPPIGPADPRFIYYATGAKMREKRVPGSTGEATRERDRLLRCRQTTIDPYVLCECKIYERSLV